MFHGGTDEPALLSLSLRESGGERGGGLQVYGFDFYVCCSLNCVLLSGARPQDINILLMQ